MKEGSEIVDPGRKKKAGLLEGLGVVRRTLQGQVRLRIGSTEVSDRRPSEPLELFAGVLGGGSVQRLTLELETPCGKTPLGSALAP